MTCKNRFICLIIILCLLTALTGCSCRHEWHDATCTTPKTCALCGETVGETIPHHWEDTSCASPSPCSMCGTLEGIEITHQWREDSKLCMLCGLDGRTPEELFSESLTAGLNENWEIKNAYPAIEVITKDAWERSFDAQYDSIAEYGEETFETDGLFFWVENYRESLIASKDALQYFDTSRWDEEYSNWIYHNWAEALYKINELCPIVIDEEYEEDLETVLKDGAAVNQISLLCEEIRFHNTERSEDKYVYEAIAENTTDVQFLSFSVDINLNDENGKVVQTESLTITAWEPGEEVRFKFTVDRPFDNIEVVSATWLN